MPAAENASSKTYSKSATGLHFDDIEKLLASFRALLDRGHTIVVVEHNPYSTTPTSSMPPTTSSSSGPNAVIMAATFFGPEPAAYRFKTLLN